MKIGIPRALLYHNYKVLWTGFFQNLGVEYIISPETNKQIVGLGAAHCIDEACFSSKIYIGHVAYLIGKCDLIFVPRFENTGIREDFCTRIIGIYDLCKNTFPNARFLHADVNYLFRKREQDAFIKLGEELGFDRETTLNAYTDALGKYREAQTAEIEKQNQILKTDKIKVLIVSHMYNTFDSIIGQSIIKYFAHGGVSVVYANIIDPAAAKEIINTGYGNRIFWKTNAELTAGVQLYKDTVDGIVLLSTFPCGPDSIFNELILRTVKDKPILNIVIDELDATAGLVTRLESFTDILEARR